MVRVFIQGVYELKFYIGLNPTSPSCCVGPALHARVPAQVRHGTRGRVGADTVYVEGRTRLGLYFFVSCLVQWTEPIWPSILRSLSIPYVFTLNVFCFVVKYSYQYQCITIAAVLFSCPNGFGFTERTVERKLRKHSSDHLVHLQSQLLLQLPTSAPFE